MTEPAYQDAERLDLPSASAMQIAVSCPGQPNLKKALPKEMLVQREAKADPDADRGTRIHLAFETGNVSTLDAEEFETYQQGLAFETAMVEAWMEDKGLPGCEEGPREKRMFLNNPQTLEPIGSAKLDRHYLSPPHLFLIDLKSGWNPNLSPSPKSWQLRFQAVCAWQEYSDLGITDVRVGHCKPKSSYGAGDVCDYSKMDLEYSLQSINFHLWETTQPDAPRHAGPQCSFCPCKAACLEAGAYAMLPTVIARRATSDSALMTWDQMVEMMTPEDLLKVWEISRISGKVGEEVTARLKQFTKEQLALLGLERGKGRVLDPITNIEAAFDFLTVTHGLPRASVFVAMEFLKGALTAAVQNHKQMTKQDASRWISEKLSPWITRLTSDAPIKRIKDTML